MNYMDSMVAAFVRFSSVSTAQFLIAPPDGGELKVSNYLYSGLNKAEAAAFEKNLSEAAPELVEFYVKSNGLRLFVDSRSDSDGIYFLPVNQMAEEKEHLRQWMEIGTDEDDYEYEEDESEGEPLTLYGLPPWFDSIVVFAGVDHAHPSGSSFVLKASIAGKSLFSFMMVGAAN